MNNQEEKVRKFYVLHCTVEFTVHRAKQATFSSKKVNEQMKIFILSDAAVAIVKLSVSVSFQLITTKMKLSLTPLITLTTSLLSTFSITVSSACADDLVKELPDFGKTPTPHYSGYLDSSAGCDTETNGKLCKIHYWMAMAEENSKDAPVVLW